MNKELENREILLTSSAFVKAVSNLSDNVAGKYLMPSIREAQEIKLKGILGHALLEKCKTLVPENEVRETLEYRKAVKVIVDSAVATAPKAE